MVEKHTFRELNHLGKNILEIQTECLQYQNFPRFGRNHMTLHYFTLLDKFDVRK